MAFISLSVEERTDGWALDFNGTGDIRADRVAQDPTLLGWVRGLLSAPDFKDYYGRSGKWEPIDEQDR